MAPTDFSGEWEEVKREGFNEIFKTLGVPDEMIKKIESFTIKNTITQEGDKITVSALLPMKDEPHVMSMIINGQEQEFDDHMTNTKAKMTPKWDGDKLVADVTSANGKKGYIERYLDGDFMIAIMEMDGHKATHHMKKC